MSSVLPCSICEYKIPLKVLTTSSRKVCPKCWNSVDFDDESNDTESSVNNNHRNDAAAQLRLPHVPATNIAHRNRFGRLSKFFNSLKNKNSRSDKENNVSPASTDDDLFDDPPINEMRRVASETDILPPITQSQAAMCAKTAAADKLGNAKIKSFVGGNAKQTRNLLRDPGSLEMAEMKPAKIEGVIMDKETLRVESYKAKATNNFSEIALFYSSAFNSFEDMNQAFNTQACCGNNKHSCVDWEFVLDSFDLLMQLPQDIQKTTLKSVINSLLTDQRSPDTVLMRSICSNYLRAYLILLLNPQFKRSSTYVVYAHLLRLLATLCDSDQNTVAGWLIELNAVSFQSIVRCIQQFISIRMFPPRPQELPPMSKCGWWIPCAVRVLSMFNVANNMAKQKIPFIDFYNSSMNHWDLMSEYFAWETPSSGGGFSFCQFPFILTISAKRQILEGHAEQQMIATARDSVIGNIAARRTPDMDMLFLNITVRRRYIVQDSMKELTNKQSSLRKKLRVQFTGEPGLDMGGLTKEWFQLLVRKIFCPDFGMFVYYDKSEVYWFSTAPTQETLQEYHLIGIVMGLAVYNGVILDIRFPLVCFKKLLSPPILPGSIDVNRAPLGVTPVEMDDLESIMPDTTRGLKQLLEYTGNVEEDFGLTFQVNADEYGSMHTYDLKENGAQIPITNDNREEYVKLYVDWYLNRSVFKQFKAFFLGFHAVCASNVMLMLRAEEVEMLVCGSVSFDMSELKKVTTYDAYKHDDRTMRYFWELVLKLPSRHQRRLLLFVTGSDRVPVGGMREMTFKISRMVSSNPSLSPIDMLPIAHTCFNQLVLPDYQDRKILRQKLAVALAHGEGFGLE